MSQSTNMQRLDAVFDGWQGYQQSLVAAVAPLTTEQLAYRPAPHLRSVGEVARHIAIGRVSWFARMLAPGSAEVMAALPAWETDEDGARFALEESLEIAGDSRALVSWLESSWRMIEQTLAAWSVEEIALHYAHKWNGRWWAVTRQWTIFRILLHDVHHGGELALMLGQQGLEPFELGALGGHLILPPLLEQAAPVTQQ